MKEYLLVVWKYRPSSETPPEREHTIWCTHFTIWDELDRYKERKVTIYEVGNCVLDWS